MNLTSFTANNDIFPFNCYLLEIQTSDEIQRLADTIINFRRHKPQDQNVEDISYILELVYGDHISVAQKEELNSMNRI